MTIISQCLRSRPSACVRRLLAMTVVGVVASSCGSDDSEEFRGPAGALFELPRIGTPPPSGFFALPFPNDIRIDDIDGRMDLDDFARPNALIELYVNTIRERVHGFSVTAASFVRFDNPIDEDSLPQRAHHSLAEDASVYLVNVDDDSPTYGERVPLRFQFQAEGGNFIGDNWLGVLPYPGFALEEQTTYALVVTDRLRATDGTPVARPEPFAAVIGTAASSDAEVTRARMIYQPLADWLDREGGDNRDNVVVASVFTTQDATSLMGDIRQVVWEDLPEPEVRDIVRFIPEPRESEEGEQPEEPITWNDLAFRWYDGIYDAPCFQRGTPPYLRPDDGGDIVRDPDTERPVIQRMEPLRFSFSVPKGPQPENGWPVVLYAHGTGGSYHSFAFSGVAKQLAAQGLAMISIDQVSHEPRIPTGSSPEILFFNFQNPLSARDNTLQGAADNFYLLRLVLGFEYSDPFLGGPKNVRFDPERIYFFGHSQGGLTGPPFLSHEPLIDAAVLSGAGGLLYYSLILKTEPLDIAALVGTFIRDSPLDEYNPMLALLQTYLDRADPVVYGGSLVREPRAGVGAKHILQTEGFTDRYTPLASIEALATSIGGDLVEPVIRDIEGLSLRGRSILRAPVSGNADGVTSVFLQYNEVAESDGHFVVFDRRDAATQYANFLGTLARTGSATLVRP